MTTYRVSMDVDVKDVFVDAMSESDAQDFCFSMFGDEPLCLEPATNVPANSTIFGYGEYCGYEYKEVREAR